MCPPLDYPLRQGFEVGYLGAHRLSGRVGGDCCSDHFASIAPPGISAGLHQIHEAIDLASGAGSCVYAAYSGTIVDKGQSQLVIDHQVAGEAYASQCLHIDPDPEKEIGDRVVKGEPIAAVKPHPAGDHLHFELWHWVTSSPRGTPIPRPVPVDPTRLLYHWEQALALDYAVLGTINFNASADLDAETAGPAVTAAYTAEGIDLPPAPQVTALAPQCAWRIIGADVTHLLRSERGSITVIEEAYGYRTVSAASLDRIGMTRRWSYPLSSSR